MTGTVMVTDRDARTSVASRACGLGLAARGNMNRFRPLSLRLATSFSGRGSRSLPGGAGPCSGDIRLGVAIAW